MKKYTTEDVISSFSFSVPIQVKFSDIDSYLHVNNGIFFQYLEHARAFFLYKVCEWDILKIGTVVANMNIDYLSPIHVMDQPVVYLRCTEVRNSSFVLEQIIMGETEKGLQKIFAQAMTTMVAVDMQTMRPVSVSEQYKLKLLGN